MDSLICFPIQFHTHCLVNKGVQGWIRVFKPKDNIILFGGASRGIQVICQIHLTKQRNIQRFSIPFILRYKNDKQTLLKIGIHEIIRVRKLS